MTIDTACSSSLVALDLAVQSLRRDECQMAVVCSSNLLFDSDIYTTADNLGLLSPSGRCHSFDSRANGYARGEGVIAIILKAVDVAVRDGNKIRCVVRETGINHDGYKAGIALPTSAAQQSLIENTYARAGLDPRKARDQCQYIEAHGTGTRAGDPIEAEALRHAFFGDPNDSNSHHAEHSISLGSIKSVVGHLEGCAGLAGILKASLMTQHGVMLPNFDFKQLHDEVKSFWANFEILQNAKPWPILPDSVPRRVSVNSFGFGGTNAHAIIEEYLPDINELKAMSINREEVGSGVLPFVFSAASQSSLQAMLGSYSKHLRDNKQISPRDLAWTLSTQRSCLPYRKYFQASKTEDLAKSIDQAISAQSFAPKRFQGNHDPTISAIFTGQGTEWNSIQELVAASHVVQSIISDLEASLSSLPQTHRPSWSLRELLLAEKTDPRRREAVFCQTINTACQIILVELIRSAGVRMTSLIGHSSGEIAAAYAAGFLRRHDAIRIAYYRGFFASQQVEKGAMLAAALPMDQAVELVKSKVFGENVEVAAVNSISSTTLSGSVGAIDSVSERALSYAPNAKMRRTIPGGSSKP
ncbi:thiolase-like protein [Trichoderma pleuroticola]